MEIPVIIRNTGVSIFGVTVNTRSVPLHLYGELLSSGENTRPSGRRNSMPDALMVCLPTSSFAGMSYLSTTVSSPCRPPGFTDDAASRVAPSTGWRPIEYIDGMRSP